MGKIKIIKTVKISKILDIENWMEENIGNTLVKKRRNAFAWGDSNYGESGAPTGTGFTIPYGEQ